MIISCVVVLLVAVDELIVEGKTFVDVFCSVDFTSKVVVGGFVLFNSI